MSEDVVLQRAQALHREYRAAEKSLRTTDTVGERPYYQHDHGWDGCHRQKYFIKRAELLIKREAEEAKSKYAAGGEIPKGKYYIVGQDATDAADYCFPMRFHESGVVSSVNFNREEIARLFQVPLSLLGWSVKTDAQLKAERDAVARRALWGKKLKYTVTAQ